MGKYSLPSCKIKLEEKCETKPRCHTDFKSVCESNPVEKCTTTNEKVCKDVTVNRCLHKKEKECTDTVEKKCKTTHEKQCIKVKVPKCKIEHKHECREELTKVCKQVPLTPYAYHPKKLKKFSKRSQDDILESSEEQSSYEETVQLDSENYDEKFAELGEDIEKAGGTIINKDKFKRDVHKVLKDKVIHKVEKLADKVLLKESLKKKPKIKVKKVDIEYTTECEDVPKKTCIEKPIEVCNDVIEKKCELVPKKSCITVDEPICKEVPETHCVEEEKCKKKPVKDCVLKQKEKCIPYPEKKCEKVPKQHCKNVQHEHFDAILKKVCRKVPDKKCEKKEVLRPREVCIPAPQTTEIGHVHRDHHGHGHKLSDKIRKLKSGLSHDHYHPDDHHNHDHLHCHPHDDHLHCYH